MTSLVFDVRGLVVRKQAEHACFELQVPHLSIRHSEMVAVVGPSGCGKSTLLDVLAMAAPVVSVERFLFSPDKSLVIDVGDLLRQNDLDALAGIRRTYLGYVLQTGGLLPFMSVESNIGLICKGGRARQKRRAGELATALGIQRHLHKKPADLSAGERQRTAIGRALAHGPAAILADEPTAALDPASSDTVMALLVRQVEQVGACCIIATHDWYRLEQLGLRRLNQHFTAAEQPEWVQSIMHD